MNILTLFLMSFRLSSLIWYDFFASHDLQTFLQRFSPYQERKGYFVRRAYFYHQAGSHVFWNYLQFLLETVSLPESVAHGKQRVLI